VFALALAFAGGLVVWRGNEDAEQFFTGYLIELSSRWTTCCHALIFAYFKSPLPPSASRVVLGILGALIMRGGMIGAGAALNCALSLAPLRDGGFLFTAASK